MPTQGNTTSEYQVTQGANTWGAIGIILGAIVAFGPTIMERLSGVVPEGSTAYVVCGAIISVASLLYRTLVSIGYIKSRTEIKLLDCTIATDGSTVSVEKK